MKKCQKWLIDNYCSEAFARNKFLVTKGGCQGEALMMDKAKEKPKLVKRDKL